MAFLDYIHLCVPYLDLLLRYYNLAVAGLFTRIRGAPLLEPTSPREMSHPAEPVTMADETDTRPQQSPFAGSSVRVRLGDGSFLSVPGSLLVKCPEIRAAYLSPTSIQLDDVNPAVGHVIFYYLLTDMYQCLRPKGDSHRERLVDELKTGVNAYIAARKYNLPGLQNLAKEEIQTQANQLPFPLVLNLFQELGLEPNAGDMWVDGYVWSGLESIFRYPTAFLEDSSLRVDQGATSFTNIILKNLADLLSKDLAPARKDAELPPEPSPEPAPAEPEHEHPAIGGEAVLLEELLPLETPEELPLQEAPSQTPPVSPEPEIRPLDPVPEVISDFSSPREIAAESTPDYVLEPALEPVSHTPEYMAVPESSNPRFNFWMMGKPKVEETPANTGGGSPGGDGPGSNPGTPEDSGPYPAPLSKKKKMKKRAIRMLEEAASQTAS
ncbi:hypothetical protein F4861DRAFT_537457 [Xylaria intraflava]|nr:hypothetical protein F4861DRAFT_537457 [Xylaria intraflava]